ncbi:MAG TPA: hypothetical protein VM389_14740, partial [Phycisphaerae bacterium]|nr:hypothetical protein [Phycisphaerae bacterium]
DEWADLGFTLAMSPRIPDTPEAHAKARRLLDLAGARGIQLILCDRRTQSPATNWSDFFTPAKLPDDFRRQAAAAVDDFADHPATWALFVLDEPVRGNFPAMAEACRTLRELTDRAEPFFNLLPDHRMSPHDPSWRIENEVGFDDFNAYLDHVVAETRATMLCYDCYCQMSEEWGGRGQYFRNLAEFQAASIRHEIPFWTITLTLGHWMYHPPSPEELGWEFFSALAYGAQGILYFLYRAGGLGGYGAPVDELGQKGPLYPQMRRQHHLFQRHWEERYRRCRVVRTTHWPAAPAGLLPFDGTGVVKAIREHSSVTYRTSPPAAVLAGEFVDDQGRPHVLIANNSPNITKHVCLQVTFAGKAVYSVNGSGEDALVASDESGLTTCHAVYIVPGQAVFYRVEA